MGKFLKREVAIVVASVGVALVVLTGEPTQAQIVTDGSLHDDRKPRALAGPDFRIPADLGKKAGGNLFHSFDKFSIRQGESATFTGPSNLKNVISRVTGGQPSDINGTLRSIVPKANFWLINPEGVTFGPHARIDVPAAFHVSTADHIKFPNGQFFSALDTAGSELSVAPPEAFGFLSPPQAGILFDGSNLSFAEGATLSFVGGDIALAETSLTVPAGQVGFMSVASGGYVKPFKNDVDVASIGTFGAVSMVDSTVDTTGDGGGRVLIRGNTLVLEGKDHEAPHSIEAGNTGEADASTPAIDIFADGGFTIKDAQIASQAFGHGVAGDIVIRAERITMEDDASTPQSSVITSGSQRGASGDGGDINLEAQDIELRNEASIEAFGLNSIGNGGNITLIASETMTIRNASVLTDALDGQGGQILLSALEIDILDGSTVETKSYGDEPGGTIMVAADRLLIGGSGTLADPNFGDVLIPSSVRSEAVGGNGGKIVIKADSIELVDGGKIVTSSEGTGDAGGVEIDARRIYMAGGIVDVSERLQELRILPSGVYASIEAFFFDIEPGFLDIEPELPSIGGFPNGGPVMISASEVIELADGATISAKVTSLGRGGDIIISAPAIIISDDALVTAASEDIDLNIEFLVAPSTPNPFVTAAGDISLTASDSVTVRGSLVTTETEVGEGGNINIFARNLFVTEGARVSANSSGEGVAGRIRVSGTEQMKLSHGAITTEALQADGGQIDIRVTDLINLKDSRITTAVAQGSGDAGNIFIDPTFLILENSRIVAKAKAGKGGNITIQAGHIIKDPDSVIDASSDLGISGRVTIDGDVRDVASDLEFETPDFADPSSLIAESCASQSGKPRSTLVRGSRAGLPPVPSGNLSPTLIADKLPGADENKVESKSNGRGLTLLAALDPGLGAKFAALECMD